MGGKIHGDYDGLADAVRTFSREANDTGSMFDRMNHAVRGLEYGGWIGQGADMFYREMNYEVLPAVQRLISVLQDAAGIVQQIVKIFQQAEYDAGQLFRGEATDGPAMRISLTQDQAALMSRVADSLKMGDHAGANESFASLLQPLVKATPGMSESDINGLILQVLSKAGVVPGAGVGDDAQKALQEIQKVIQQENMQFSSISSAINTLHDTAKSIINNVR
jgi:WXG100 family type VII secretion target